MVCQDRVSCLRCRDTQIDPDTYTLPMTIELLDAIPLPCSECSWSDSDDDLRWPP